MAAIYVKRALLKERAANRDVYVGTAQQLCSAGLVRLDQIPGLAGTAKVAASFFVSDGLPVPKGASCFEPTFTVQRQGASTYRVTVHVGDAEARRRSGLADGAQGLPLQLPGEPASDEVPAWMPKGWAFKQHRENSHDYVFVATAEQLRDSGIVGSLALPVIEDATRRTARFRSDRFGWSIVAQRAGNTFFVVLRAPCEVRCAEYTKDDYGHVIVSRGTKEQILADGFALNIGFPGEPGSNVRKVTTHHPKSGEAVSIELLSRWDWFGDVPRFEVRCERSADAQMVLKILKASAVTPEEFRLQARTKIELYLSFVEDLFNGKEDDPLQLDMPDGGQARATLSGALLEIKRLAATLPVVRAGAGSPAAGGVESHAKRPSHLRLVSSRASVAQPS